MAGTANPAALIHVTLLAIPALDMVYEFDAAFDAPLPEVIVWGQLTFIFAYYETPTSLVYRARALGHGAMTFGTVQPLATVTFVVPGIAGTKGSNKMVFDARTQRVIQKPSSKFLKPWTRDCQNAAFAARVPLIPKGIGVHVYVTYEFARPTTKRWSQRASPCIKPDVDKLARALLDALTGIAYADDEQVVELLVKKVCGNGPRATVTIGRAVAAITD